MKYMTPTKNFMHYFSVNSLKMTSATFASSLIPPKWVSFNDPWRSFIPSSAKVLSFLIKLVKLRLSHLHKQQNPGEHVESTSVGSVDRVVDLALNQAAKPWKPIFRSSLVPSVALFPKMYRGQICNLCWEPLKKEWKSHTYLEEYK